MEKNANIKGFRSKDGEYPLDAYTIRENVFVREQGASREQEFDEIDNNALHLVAYHDGKPCGTLRLHKVGKKWRLSKLCVLKEYRGNHIGEELMDQAFSTLPEGDDLFLAAKGELAHYFARCGFETTDDEIMFRRVPAKQEEE